jgi:predicted thioesterase
MERLEVAGRPPLEGLIESEDRDWITMIQIRRPPGRPMYLVIRPIDRASVRSVARLDPAQRETLRHQIEAFRNRAAIEAGRMEAVRLETAEADGNRYQRYRGRWFTLDSTVGEAVTRRVIVRTEQIFTAYRQILPPRTAPQEPPRLVVLGSMASYQAFLGRLGVRMQNRACFLEEKNLVVAGSELERLVASTAKTNAQNEQLRGQLKALEDRLTARLREMAESLRKEQVPPAEVQRLLGLERGKFQHEAKNLRSQIDLSDGEAARVFRQSTRQTFARLGHESFHAYLENYVYPHARFDVPSWLNEGLAVMFEGGMLEGETLRVDAPNLAALKKIKADLAGAEPLGLAKLLAAGPSAFLPADQAAVASADRYYAYAWGLAYWLTFQKRLLEGPSLERYVERGNPAGEPAVRFQQLLAAPLESVEAQWRTYIVSLKCAP